ncbi:hypothetical protein WR25_12475 isoform A [Diploscapter pachys]|uniref:Uncharacterized protein n=1 Tax=Diploscapter pachys TaxID=2018661 RepID=A0A2A2KD21_9BILA|nr:hypothetical protein WR25_12475 isoform A [Diploscapter pachys]
MSISSDNQTLIEDLLHAEDAHQNYSNQSWPYTTDFPSPNTLFPISQSASENDSIDDFIYPPELNFTGFDYTNETNLDDHFNVQKVFRFLDEHDWLVFVLIGSGIIIVLAIIIAIIVFIVKHKKRVIRENEDPILTSTYEERFSWRRCFCCCCPESAKERERREGRGRQNSESNLEAYKRTKLPPIEYDNKHNTLVRASINNNNSNNNNATLNNNNSHNSHKTYTVDEKNLAIHIDGIHGIPSIPIQPNMHRKLPPLPRTE